MSIQDRLTAALSDRHAIWRELGQGGMATVRLAENLKHDREVAVKVLKPDMAAVVGGDRFIGIQPIENASDPEVAFRQRHFIVTNWFAELQARLDEAAGVGLASSLFRARAPRRYLRSPPKLPTLAAPDRIA